MRILARDHRREFHRLGERFFGDMRRKAQRLRLYAVEFAVGVDHLAQHVVGNLVRHSAMPATSGTRPSAFP